MTAHALRRAVLSIPLLGRMLREVTEGPEENFWYLMAALICLWLISGLTWGLPGLVVPAVIAAPAMLVLLMVMVWG